MITLRRRTDCGVTSTHSSSAMNSSACSSDIGRGGINFSKLSDDDERMLVAAMRKLRTTQAESAILVAFLKRTHVSKGSLHMLITRDQSKPPSVKLVDVMICKLRKKLPDGVKIENLWGVGYYITSDAKQTILAYLQVDS